MTGTAPDGHEQRNQPGSAPATARRSLGWEVEYIRTAAAVEAVALHHPEVDVEHLLLGLLATGGPSGRVLTEAGTDLAAVRRGVREVQRLQLADLGIAAAPPPAAVHASGWSARNALPLNSRAEELLHTASHRGDDRGLLLALLDDDGRRVQRLLEHLGVDVDRLRQLATGPLPVTDPAPGEAPGAPGADLRGPVPEGTHWMHASYSQTLPVPPDRVWALVGDPARRPEWDPACSAHTVAADGTERFVGSGGRAVAQRVIHLVPGQQIAWRRSPRALADDGDGTDGNEGNEGGHEILQITVAPEGTGSTVHLRRDWPVRGRSWRPLRPGLVQMVRAQLRMQAQSIGQVAG